MNKVKLLTTLLFAGAFALGTAQGAFAATTASQTCTGTLGQMKKVVDFGGNIGSVINTDTGVLETTFNPTFRMTTNTSNATALILSSTCNTSTVAQNAFVGDGASNTTFLVLTNNTILPTVAAVNDAKAAVPVDTQNPNVIAYPITKPADIATQLAYTWNAAAYYDASLTHSGNTDTALIVPAAAAKANTYSFDDGPGAYQATVTLSYV